MTIEESQSLPSNIYDHKKDNTKDKRLLAFNAAPVDDENSEYYHLIYWSDYNKTPMKGYSSKVGFPEKFGSVPNLINYVVRMTKHLYYPGSTRGIVQMEYYKNHVHELVVRLYPGYSMWSENYAVDPAWDIAQQRISQMWDMMDKGHALAHVAKKCSIPAKRPGKDGFNPNDVTPRFWTDKEAVKHANYLINQGYPHGEVTHWLRMYREKHFSYSNQIPKPQQNG